MKHRSWAFQQYSTCNHSFKIRALSQLHTHQLKSSPRDHGAAFANRPQAFNEHRSPKNIVRMPPCFKLKLSQCAYPWFLIGMYEHRYSKIERCTNCVFSSPLPSPSLINRDGCSAIRQACLTWHLQAAGCKPGVWSCFSRRK